MRLYSKEDCFSFYYDWDECTLPESSGTSVCISTEGNAPWGDIYITYFETEEELEIPVQTMIYKYLGEFADKVKASKYQASFSNKIDVTKEENDELNQVPLIGRAMIGACDEPAFSLQMSDTEYYFLSTENGPLSIILYNEAGNSETKAELHKILDSLVIEGVNWNGEDVMDRVADTAKELLKMTENVFPG